MGFSRRSLFYFGLLGVFFGAFFLSPRPPVAAQSSLETELRNLERVSAGSAGRREALIRMAGLKELAGDIEGAAGAWEMAAQAEPPDHLSMLRGAACFIALGNWERAEAALMGVLSGGAGGEVRIHARFLAAQLEALRSGGANTSALVSLLGDGTFGAYTSRIYFTLWKLTGRESWLSSLTREYPGSPEAAAAGSKGTVHAAATAMWLLFPGRQGAPSGSAAANSGAAGSTATGSAATNSGATSSAVTSSAVSGTVLQAGLFSREENARGLLEKLRGAGFSADSTRQNRAGATYIMVYVIPGPDINASIRELKAAGFESFPVSVHPG
ncbi:MAG: SPOR domain-containing protein [Treponema sp.]|jgi:hypothetical protein|nr:SPOR domain-containing protein [Treponema sp.]